MNTDVAAALQAPVLSAHGLAMLVFAAVVLPADLGSLSHRHRMPWHARRCCRWASRCGRWIRRKAGRPDALLLGLRPSCADCHLLVDGAGQCTGGHRCARAGGAAAGRGSARHRCWRRWGHGGAGAVSGLINDTPVVVLLIPLVIAVAQRAKVSARRYVAADELCGADRRHGHDDRHLDQPDRGGHCGRARSGSVQPVQFLSLVARPRCRRCCICGWWRRGCWRMSAAADEKLSAKCSKPSSKSKPTLARRACAARSLQGHRSSMQLIEVHRGSAR